MRAVTWSERFDLNRELDRLQEIAASGGFDVPDETLMRVLAIALGYPTASDSMLAMRELSAKQLREGVTNAADIIERTLDFFRSELEIQQYDLVPYEAQLLAAAGFYKVPGQAPPAAIEQLARWFWTASFNEDLAGRSEHRVARIVQEMEEVRAGKAELKGRITLTTAALKERRFRWRGALSSALAAMLARNAARSLFSGEIIGREMYLGPDARTHFMSLVDENKVAKAIGMESGSAKVIANTIVVGKGERSELRRLSASEVILQLRRFRSDASEVLASQFISESAADAILQDKVADFLEARAQSILSFAMTLAFPASGAS
jgi:hypothetical protein